MKTCPQLYYGPILMLTGDTYMFMGYQNRTAWIYSQYSMSCRISHLSMNNSWTIFVLFARSIYSPKRICKLWVPRSSVGSSWFLLFYPCDARGRQSLLGPTVKSSDSLTGICFWKLGWTPNNRINCFNCNYTRVSRQFSLSTWSDLPLMLMSCRLMTSTTENRFQFSLRQKAIN